MSGLSRRPKNLEWADASARADGWISSCFCARQIDGFRSLILELKIDIGLNPVLTVPCIKMSPSTFSATESHELIERLFRAPV